MKILNIEVYEDEGVELRLLGPGGAFVEIYNPLWGRQQIGTCGMRKELAVKVAKQILETCGD